MSLTAPAQGLRRWPSLTSYFQRGTTPNEIWYALGAQNQTAFGTTAYSAGLLRLSPFSISRHITIDRLAFEVTATGVGAVARIGIYRATSLTNVQPSTLIVDGGEQDCSSATGVKAATVNVTLSPGFYWLAHLGGVATCTIRTTAGAIRQPQLGSPATIATLHTTAEAALAYQALPTTAPTINSAAGTYATPVAAIRCSA